MSQIAAAVKDPANIAVVADVKCPDIRKSQRPRELQDTKERRPRAHESRAFKPHHKERKRSLKNPNDCGRNETSTSSSDIKRLRWSPKAQELSSDTKNASFTEKERDQLARRLSRKHREAETRSAAGQDLLQDRPRNREHEKQRRPENKKEAFLYSLPERPHRDGVSTSAVSKTAKNVDEPILYTYNESSSGSFGVADAKAQLKGRRIETTLRPREALKRQSSFSLLSTEDLNENVARAFASSYNREGHSSVSQTAKKPHVGESRSFAAAPKAVRGNAPTYTRAVALFPTDLSIDQVVTSRSCFIHLRLLLILEEFRRSLSGPNESVLLMRAESRYLKFLFYLHSASAFDSGMAHHLAEGRFTPPLDVLLLWHVHMANTRSYVEDVARLFHPLVLEIAYPAQSVIHLYETTRGTFYHEASALKWESIMGEPYDLASINPNAHFIILCPKCQKEIPIQPAEYVKLHSDSGYRDTRCVACLQPLTLGYISALRLVTDIHRAFLSSQNSDTLLNTPSSAAVPGAPAQKNKASSASQIPQSESKHVGITLANRQDEFSIPDTAATIQSNATSSSTCCSSESQLPQIGNLQRSIASTRDNDVSCEQLLRMRQNETAHYVAGTLLHPHFGQPTPELAVLLLHCVAPEHTQAAMLDALSYGDFDPWPRVVRELVRAAHNYNSVDQNQRSLKQNLKGAVKRVSNAYARNLTPLSINLVASLASWSEQVGLITAWFLPNETRHARASKFEKFRDEMQGFEFAVNYTAGVAKGFKLRHGFTDAPVEERFDGSLVRLLTRSVQRYQKFMQLQRSLRESTHIQLGLALDMQLCNWTHRLQPLRYLDYSNRQFSRLCLYYVDDPVLLHRALKNTANIWIEVFKERYSAGYAPDCGFMDRASHFVESTVGRMPGFKRLLAKKRNQKFGVC